MPASEQCKQLPNTSNNGELVYFDDCQHVSGTMFEIKGEHAGVLSFPQGVQSVEDYFLAQSAAQSAGQIVSAKMRIVPAKIMSDLAKQTYQGSCHCGRVRFRVTGDLARVTECNCSICTKKGFLHLIVPPDQFELISGADALTTYRFNTGTARHTFCGTCGIHPFYVPRSDPDKIDVNVRCLDGVDLAALKPHPFDGRNWEHAMTEKAPWR